jgi:Fur family iron response transcriptional regulator
VDRVAIAELLEEKGLLVTHQRLEIAALVLNRPQHLSADQILSAMRDCGSRVSKATVYNTMKLFCEHGIVRAVEVDHARQYYDSTSEPHHHFYNVDTGVLTDIPPDQVEINIATSLPPGTEQESVDVVIRVRSERT